MPSMADRNINIKFPNIETIIQTSLVEGDLAGEFNGK
jgi:hypothetical protein